MKRLKFLCSLLCVVSFVVLNSVTALANFELRLHYGPLSGSPSSFNSALDATVTDHPDVGKPNLLGADALYVMPIFPFLFGIRYEQWDQKKDGAVVSNSVAGTANATFKGSRTSLLLGYRLLSLPILYVGGIAQYGISQNMQYSRDLTLNGSTTSSTYGVGAAASYGVGVEAGVTLVGFLLGAEVGYMSLKSNTVTDGTGANLKENGNDVILDMSGTYMKVMLGISI